MGNTVATRAKLTSGAAELGVVLDEPAQHALLSFLALLKRWNKVYNLTAIKGDDNMLTRHLLDSLSVVTAIKGSRLIDIGTGAGLPGIPIAITNPHIQVTLLDSNAKRCRFLRQVQAQLKLDNVSIVQKRVEEYQPAEKFDNLLSRAFSSLHSFISSSAHLLAEDGQFIAMKGIWPGDETEQLTSDFIIDEVVKIMVPGLPVQRHLVICKKVK
jgi:16S rRNA (guanine527-N7)-methyltransferase